MADVKTLRFCHLRSDIRHSGCVFQHPVLECRLGRISDAGTWHNRSTSSRIRTDLFYLLSDA